MTLYRFNTVARRSGVTYGMHREMEGASYREARAALRAKLISEGWIIVKIERADAGVSQ